VTEQAYAMAHLRDLPSCQTCGKAATVQLYSGVNAPMGYFCKRCGNGALRRFKKGEPV
jgi:hypothetical protein